MSFFKGVILFLTISVSYGRIDMNVKCAPPNQASFSGDKCWMLVSIPMNFIEAAQYCRSFEGNLTSIHSAFDNIYLADLAHFFSHDFYYIGGTNLDDRKTWAWMDGSVMDFTDWGNYEPIDGILNNCLVVGVGHGMWHTHDCTTSSPFVCEVPEDHSLPTTPPMPQTTTSFRPIWTTSTMKISTTTTQPNWNTSTVAVQTMTAPPMSTVNVQTTTAQPKTTTAPVLHNVTSPVTPPASGGSSVSVSAPVQVSNAASGATSTAPPPPVSAAKTNSHSDQNPSSTAKRLPQESSTPNVGSGASSNRLFNSLLTSIAVGKAAEYFPKFDGVRKHKKQQKPRRFKSYRQQ